MIMKRILMWQSDIEEAVKEILKYVVGCRK